MNAALASSFAKLALACVTREYPNKIDHVLFGDADAKSPRALHPAFYGCLDWHSAVHGHWMLARLLRFDIPEAPAIRAVLAAHLTPENIAIEAAYFTGRDTFERMYGWSWLLALATEVAGLDPLVEAIVTRLHAFLPKQAHPIRTGTHANTAFALGLILDYARAVGDTRTEALVVERSMTYFAADRDAPIAWEPSGDDFLSPSLVEADLMRRVLPDFAPWLAAFLPRMPLAPVAVTDRSDPKLAHLDGLNLSRAWCLRALGYDEAADAHAAAGLAHVATGDYAGEHWLATFAVYLLTRSASRG